MSATVNSFSCGSIGVMRIKETLGAAFPPAHLLPDLPADAIERNMGWLVPGHYDPAKRRFVMGTHSWLLRTKHHTILVDTCIGNHKPRPGSPGFNDLELPYLDRLAHAGCKPEDIDLVLCTHLHVDHVGWNTQLRDGRWVPTFPNAKVLCSKAELVSAEAKANANRPGEDDRAIWQDSLLPVLEAGQLQTIVGAHAIEDGLLVEPTPGHTPGHVVLRAESGGERMLFAGDLCHHPLQVYYPDVNSRFCEHAEGARATRRRILADCAESGALFAPAHWGPPHAARVEATAAAFALKWP
jgi:glyoxylase-like metal-dependent hydrolase (beta-lactamase superfamily II)